MLYDWWVKLPYLTSLSIIPCASLTLKPSNALTSWIVLFLGCQHKCTIFVFQYSLAPPRYGSTSAMQPPRQYAYSGGPQQPNPPSQAGWGQTMLPQPKPTGIPRPGSRIPGPRTTSGIPKPGGYSQPGSRASSIGPRKMSADTYYWMKLRQTKNSCWSLFSFSNSQDCFKYCWMVFSLRFVVWWNFKVLFCYFSIMLT